MKSIVGIGLIVLGIILGLYVGVYLCFVGGIVDLFEVIQQISNTPDYVIESKKIAWGIVKIMSTCLVGYATALTLIIPGYGVLIK